MPKIGIRDIAAVLAKKKEMPVEEAEKYIDAFFNLINESLVSDKIVKIRGFGTFKLVEVRDRESVDVNTGERMVIDGHSKISFVPDNTLKELVNKPFSQFETVVLNDGVDFDRDKDLLSDESTADKVSGAEPEAAQDVVQETASADAPETSEKADEEILPASITKALDDARVSLDDANATETAPEEQQPETAKPGGDEKEPEKEADPPSPVSEQIDADTINLKPDSHNALSDEQETHVTEHKNQSDEHGNRTEEHDAQSDEHKVEPDSRKVELDERKVELGDHKVELEENGSVSAELQQNTDVADDMEETGRKHSLARKMLYVAAGIVVIFLIFFGGYYIGKYVGTVAEAPKETAKSVAAPVVKRAPAVKPTPAVAAKDTLKQLADSTKRTEAVKEDHKDVKENVEPSKESGAANPAELANARRMVQTGAYVIDGFDRSVKVKAGQTLNSISRFYLGEGMECYIMVYNNTTELKEGETLNIPKLKLKKKATNKKVS